MLFAVAELLVTATYSKGCVTVYLTCLLNSVCQSHHCLLGYYRTKHCTRDFLPDILPGHRCLNWKKLTNTITNHNLKFILLTIFLNPRGNVTWLQLRRSIARCCSIAVNFPSATQELAQWWPLTSDLKTGSRMVMTSLPRLFTQSSQVSNVDQFKAVRVGRNRFCFVRVTELHYIQFVPLFTTSCVARQDAFAY